MKKPKKIKAVSALIGGDNDAAYFTKSAKFEHGQRVHVINTSDPIALRTQTARAITSQRHSRQGCYTDQEMADAILQSLGLPTGEGRARKIQRKKHTPRADGGGGGSGARHRKNDQ